MIKVSFMYPHQADGRFDHDYFREHHVPRLLERLGDVVKSCTIDKGLGGSLPGMPATYVASCHLVVDSRESFQSAFAPHARESFKDTPHYTNLRPLVQYSEVFTPK